MLFEKLYDFFYKMFFLVCLNYVPAIVKSIM
jgi:hypothetical protein